MASTFTLTRQVEFHETDLAGIVHFSNFFRYMEATEHAFVRSLGHSIAPTEPVDGVHIGWPRVHAECDYKAPLRFEDEVRITLKVAEKKSRALVYDFTFEKISGDAPVLVATGRLVAACVAMDPATNQMKAVPIPAAIAELIEAG